MQLLNEKYAQTCMNNEKVSTDGVVVIDEEVTPEKAANNYYQMTKRIAALPNLNFYFDVNLLKYYLLQDKLNS